MFPCIQRITAAFMKTAWALVATCMLAAPLWARATTAEDLAPTLQVGDLVFIRVSARPFLEVAAATGSWTNHVGIVVDTSGPEPLLAESTFPRSKHTPWRQFVARSEGGRVAVARPDTPLSASQQQAVAQEARQRLGVHYDTGFDLYSRGQFCSRFVREVLLVATGKAVGEVESFQALLHRQPDAHLGFWRWWYLGSIPWQRQTVTPASVLASGDLHRVFDGSIRAQ
jgi:hypothetical protein